MLHHNILASETIQWVFCRPCSNHLAMHSMRLLPPTASTFPSRPQKANGWQSHEVREMQASLYACNLQWCRHRPLPTTQLLQQKPHFHYGQTETMQWPIVHLLDSVRRTHHSRKLGLFLSFTGGCQMCFLKLVDFVGNTLDHETWSRWGLNPVENTSKLGGGWECASLWLPAIGWQSYPW